MMKFNFFKRSLAILLLVGVVFLQSCEKTPDQVIKPGATGFFIVNEGAYGFNNASLSYYDRAKNEIINDVFLVKNNVALGDQAQSMTLFEGKGYVVVQGSKWIAVVNPDDFSAITKITEGMENPRYFVGISPAKAYVSDWGTDGITGTVKVLDLATYKVVKSISTGKGANRMLKVGNLVYVANSGGFGTDNTISIIDTNSDTVVRTITIGDNPNSLQKDKDDNIWVAASGSTVYTQDFSIDEEKSTKGSISKINSANTEVLRLTANRFTFGNISNLTLSLDGGTLYYTFDDAMYSMNISAITLPTIPFKEKNYYGLAVDPFNGNIIGCFPPNFTSAGSIDVYDPQGNLQKTFDVGIAPNGCAFK
jgi:YVTN family beta-propeller protein